MSRLPKVRIVRASASQKRALARWLKEWMIDKALRDDRHDHSAEGMAPGATGNSSGLLYDISPAKVGQIRLFHPFSGEAAARPRYIAVLQEKTNGSWLVAPFSGFSEPAVPGEVKTGRRVPVLRNLCIWNARSLPGPVLERSWVVDRMSDSRISQAVMIHGLLAAGKELPRSVCRRVGPPLVHPLDPRVEYLEAEREWFSALSAKAPAGRRIDSPYAPSEDGDRSLPLAAEERAKYAPSKGRTKKKRGSDRDR